MNKKICEFFLKGKCKFGNQCHNLHTFPPNYQSNPMTKPQSHHHAPKNSVCTFFLKNACTRPNCPFFHGYGNFLQHVKTYENEKIINNLIKVNEKEFISCDESSFKIWGFNPGFEKLKEEKIPEGIIHNLIYSNGKIFIINKFLN